MHPFRQQPHRWWWGCCCLWSLVPTADLHRFILMKRWTFSGFQVTSRFFLCVVFLQVPCGSGIGFQPAGTLVFSFLLAETPSEDDLPFPGAALKCSHKQAAGSDCALHAAATPWERLRAQPKWVPVLFLTFPWVGITWISWYFQKKWH